MLYLSLCGEKDENKQKEARLGPFKKLWELSNEILIPSWNFVPNTVFVSKFNLNSRISSSFKTMIQTLILTKIMKMTTTHLKLNLTKMMILLRSGIIWLQLARSEISSSWKIASRIWMRKKSTWSLDLIVGQHYTLPHR